MPYTLENHGSWTDVYSADPTEVAAALALPGSWLWHEQGMACNVLVRNDQVGALPAPVTITGYTPDPFVMPGTGTVTGTGLMAVTTIGFADADLNSLNICIVSNQTDTSMHIQQLAPNQAYPQFIYIADASSNQLAPLYPINTTS